MSFRCPLVMVEQSISSLREDFIVTYAELFLFSSLCRKNGQTLETLAEKAYNKGTSVINTPFRIGPQNVRLCGLFS